MEKFSFFSFVEYDFMGITSKNRPVSSALYIQSGEYVDIISFTVVFLQSLTSSLSAKFSTPTIFYMKCHSFFEN
jgi:hypothetical protein